MKNSGGKFWLKGAAIGVMIFVLLMGLAWFVDFAFNGVALELFSYLASRSFASRQNLYRVYITLSALFSAIVAFTGILSARRVYKRQNALLTRAREEASRAQELARLEMERKNDLITYLAHDLKTPLSSVIGYLSLLDEARDLPAPQREKYVGVALEKANRLDQLIGEFFDIVRFNLQSIPLDRRRIPLRLMLEQLSDEFYPMLRQQGRRALVDCPDGLTVYADPDKLARVFNNILKNAAAYGRENTPVTITARQEAKGVSVCVANQGDPIPEREQAVIFEKFYRLDGARSTRTGGAGLGLAIARDIVRAHGGQIGVKSDGEGTRFTVYLPNPEKNA